MFNTPGLSALKKLVDEAKVKNAQRAYEAVKNQDLDALQDLMKLEVDANFAAEANLFFTILYNKLHALNSISDG
jgi:hypothetical protein